MGSIWVDLKDGVVERAGGSTTLTDKEAALLRYLSERPGQLVCRAQLNAEVWGYHPDSTSRAIDKTLARLRAKIEENTAHPRFLKTVRGEGWRLVMATGDAPALPAPRGGLFGRQATIARLERWWEQGGRWTTIVGIGGMGKTRLAIEVARKVATQARVLWVDLTGVDTEVGLLSATALALGLRPAETGRLTGALAQRIDLLVLDNLEDLAGIAGAVVGAWVSGAPTLRVLGTSRIRLQGAGEQTLLLPPLDEAGGAEMLMTRLGWPAAAAEDAATISRSLDGIPLAIELIAAAAGPLTPAMLTAQATRILERASLSGAPSRHTTISAAIESNLSRLSESERAALASLAILPGSFPLELGEVVIGGADPLTVLMALMGHSFIHPDGERLRLLLPIRQALSQPGDAAVSWARLVPHLAAQVRALEGPPTPLQGWCVSVGVPILEAALQHAVAAGDADALALVRAADILSGASPADRIARFVAVLDAVEGPVEERIRVEIVLASRLLVSADRGAGEARFAEICERTHALGLTELEALAWVRRSGRGSNEERIAFARHSRTLTQDPVLTTTARISEGFGLRALGRLDEARSVWQQAQQAELDPVFHAQILFGLGGLSTQPDTARAWLARIQEETFPPLYKPNLDLLRGFLFLNIDEPDNALTFLYEAMHWFLQVGDQHNLLHTLWNITLCHALRCDRVQYRRYYTKTTALFEHIDNTLKEQVSLGRLILQAWDSDWDAARATLQEWPDDHSLFWSSVTLGMSGDLEGMAQAAVLSATQQRVITALAGGRSAAESDVQAMEDALDFETNDRILLSFVRARIWE